MSIAPPMARREVVARDRGASRGQGDAGRLPAPAVEARTADERLDVAPLLAAYHGALALARRPPASLALPRPLELLHRGLRPRLACHYFATRYVLRRTAALERALVARMALGRVAEDDRIALESVRDFRASLTPSPRHAWLLGGLIAAVLASQALVGWLLELVSEARKSNGDPTAIAETVKNISLSPDVRSIGAVIRALVAANFIQLGVVLLSILAVVYIFGRPLASGFRLAALCLDQRSTLSPRRRRSPLCSEAGRLGVARHEAAVASHADVPLRRDVPIDLVVKAVPCFAMAYLVIGLLRFSLAPGDLLLRLGAWLAASAALLAGLSWIVRRAGWLRRRGMWIVRLLLTVAGLLIVARLALGAEFVDPALLDPRQFALTWPVLAVLSIIALTPARLGWLAVRAPGCTPRVLCFGLPLALVVAVGLVKPFDPSDSYGAASASTVRGYALDAAQLGELPRVGRDDLQLLLASRRDLVGVDLRTQDFHAMSLRRKDLSHAQLMLANLDRADLVATRLRGADLRGVTADAAILRRADLRGADLRCANLEGADLHRASLGGAHLAGAVEDELTLWPAGVDPRRRGVRTREQVLDDLGASEFSFDGYLADACVDTWSSEGS